MKALLSTLLLFSTSLFAAEFPVSGQAKKGFCYPQLQSKTYKSGSFSSPFPRTFEIQCEYKCFNGASFDNIIAVESRTFHNSNDEGRNLVCRGAVMKQVTEWGTTYWKVTGREFFLSHLSNASELRHWAQRNSINYSLVYKTKIHLEAIEQLKHTVASYTIAGQSPTSIARQFLLASEELDYYTLNTEASNAKLQSRIKEIKAVDDISLTSPMAKRLLYQVISTQFKYLF